MRFILLMLAAVSASAAPGRPPAPKPRIHARAEWGAGPSGAADEPDPVKLRIIVHHTATAVTDAERAMNDAQGLEAAKEEMRAVYDEHVRVEGWSDIGYHYVIDWQGRIFEGRPVELLGAHSESHNPQSIGIALMGNLQEQPPTDAQLRALHDLTDWLLDVYAISPEHVEGHHHYNSTACPGKFLEDDSDPNTPLRTLRRQLIAERRVGEELGNSIARLRAWSAAFAPESFFPR